MNGPYGLLYKLLAAGVILAALLFGWKKLKEHYREEGRQEVQAKWDKAVEKGRAEIARIKSEAGKVTTVTEVQTVEKIKYIREKGDEIIKQVEVFVPVAGQCATLDGGFRVFHDAAVENRIPNPTEIADAAPTTPTEVAATVAENYKRCNVAYETVEMAQKWLIEQCKINGNKDCASGGQ